jgi:hypothetical protein
MLDYATLTRITEEKLRECADLAAGAVEEVELRQYLDMGHGVWQLWLALAADLDKEAARRDDGRLYAMIEPTAISGLEPVPPNKRSPS